MSSSLESISNQLQLVEARKEDLRKAYELLQSHSKSCPSSFCLPFQWQDIENHFLSIQNSIHQSFEHLLSKERRCQQILQYQPPDKGKGKAVVVESQPSDQGKGKAVVDRSQLSDKSKGNAVGFVESQPSDKGKGKAVSVESQPSDKGKGKAVVIESQPSDNGMGEAIKSLTSDKGKGETPTAEKTQEPGAHDIKSKPSDEGDTPQEASARELQSLIMKNLENLQAIFGMAVWTLRSSSNPAKLALDVLEGLDVEEGWNFLLGLVMHVAPEVDISEKERALKMAVALKEKMGRNVCESAAAWKEKITTAPKCKPASAGKQIMTDAAQLSCNVRAFIQLVASYGLASDFDAEELFILVGKFNLKKSVNLCRKLGLLDKIPDHIQKLVGEGRQVAAVNVIVAYGLVEKFPPIPLLEAFLDEARKASQELVEKEGNKTMSWRMAILKEISALNKVIAVIKQHKLDAKSWCESLEIHVAMLLKKQTAKSWCESLEIRVAKLRKKQTGRKRKRRAKRTSVQETQPQPAEERPQPAAASVTHIPTAASFPHMPYIQPLPQPAGLLAEHVSPCDQLDSRI